MMRETLSTIRHLGLASFDSHLLRAGGHLDDLIHLDMSSRFVDSIERLGAFGSCGDAR